MGRRPPAMLPKSPTSQLIQGLRYRFYSATNEYLGVKDGRVFYFKPGSMPAPTDVGSLNQYLNPALGEGF